ncbi:MAG TPA: CHRD domain-containing protein [Bryobacteraceae bacterium]|nr:CHRD domain-containing protein [Bryobacteraceae bacterium]
MKRFLTLALFSAITLLGQRAETIIFRGTMLPSNEIPAIDINASGSAVMRAHVVRNAAGEVVSGTVDFIVSYTFPGEMEFTGLHIHRGDATVNGPVMINTGLGGAVTIKDPTGRGVINRSAQVRPTDTAAVSTLRDMIANPAGFYVNLHSTVNPGGVIRAQLQKAETVTLMTLMSPANEVPPITTAAASGITSVTAMRTFDAGGNLSSGLILFEADYQFDKQVTLSGYHIHAGPAGVNAAVTISSGITPMPTPENGGGSLLFPVEVNLTNPVQVSTLNGLFTDPNQYYANIHTTEFPGGIIRGQLRRTDENVFLMNMLPSNEVPPVNIDASGVAAVRVNTLRNDAGEAIAARVVFDVNYRFPAAVTFTGLHIHNQVAGQNGPVIISTGLSADNTVASTDGFGNIYIPVLVTSATGLATVNSMLASPEKHYINLHSTVTPSGVIRAQIAPAFSSAPSISVATTADYETGIKDVAPGGWMSIFGQRLSYAETDYFSWDSSNVPTSLNGVEVTVGGIKAPVLKITPTRVDVQVPYEVQPGTQPVIVKNAVGSSNTLTVNVRAFAPAIWLSGPNRGLIGRVTDFTLITAGNAAQVGDVLAIFATGVGQTTPALQTGKAVPEGLFSTASAVTATLGGRPLPVLAATAYPGLPGTHVVVVVVPPGTASGDQALDISIGGQTSNRVNLPVR